MININFLPAISVHKKSKDFESWWKRSIPQKEVIFQLILKGNVWRSIFNLIWNLFTLSAQFNVIFKFLFLLALYCYSDLM